ncbi:hypothetical protein K505DRAFT_320043 [Melanomma pulvis-pyrius CBS 109.77]|uniref:Uncharacterized protein n=1 Tax=Melanomma pulvis-pyrius CBS 109.77 TaxID=1314802 RepID=A0A6A6XXV2_9PLEO|nr:hypothetical protein K505DRAFT_320043 [Melanomma pulvis-pyrius CBS 109.77]
MERRTRIVQAIVFCACGVMVFSHVRGVRAGFFPVAAYGAMLGSLSDYVRRDKAFWIMTARVRGNAVV